MQICPICETRYPAGDTHCDHDGSIRIPESTTPEGFDVSVSGFDGEEHASQTSAESPGGRQRTDAESGTRVSIGKPPSMLGTKPTAGEKGSRTRTRSAAEARCGEVLGSYRLQSVLGFGGMGAVYTAEHLRLGRRVALKLLHAQYAARREAVARFFQEAQAVNRSRHKNIVDVTDLVELDDGTAFIIMELLEGESLGERLRRLGLLDERSAPNAATAIDGDASFRVDASAPPTTDAAPPTADAAPFGDDAGT